MDEKAAVKEETAISDAPMSGDEFARAASVLRYGDEATLIFDYGACDIRRVPIRVTGFAKSTTAVEFEWEHADHYARVYQYGSEWARFGDGKVREGHWHGRSNGAIAIDVRNAAECCVCLGRGAHHVSGLEDLETCDTCNGTGIVRVSS